MSYDNEDDNDSKKNYEELWNATESNRKTTNFRKKPYRNLMGMYGWNVTFACCGNIHHSGVDSANNTFRFKNCFFVFCCCFCWGYSFISLCVCATQNSISGIHDVDDLFDLTEIAMENVFRNQTIIVIQFFRFHFVCNLYHKIVWHVCGSSSLQSM